MDHIVQISLPIPKDANYSYRVPKHLVSSVDIGVRVFVPLGGRKIIGFVVGFGEEPQGVELKDIIDVLDDEPLFDKKRLEFFRWISNYYFCPLGLVLKAAHPGVLSSGIKRRVFITNCGKKRLCSTSGSSLEKKILKILELKPGITIEKLLSLSDDLKLADVLLLKRKGCIEFQYEFRNRANKKFRKLVSIGKNKDLNYLQNKPAKKAIYDFVSRHEVVSLSLLNEHFSNVSTHIKFLEQKGFVEVILKEEIRDPFVHIEKCEGSPPELTVHQKEAFQRISGSLEDGKFSPFLLHGVTGSGKTEVYLRSIAKALDKGKQAIVLVPEISLTPQLVKRFKQRFGDLVAVIHSMLSEGERFDAWRLAREGKVRIIIGARSAIFAPFSDLGIIIVDEEHESSYKQEESPCYNARDVALMLGKMTNSVVVLGSATPSLESYRNATTGKFSYLSLPVRVKNRSLPRTQTVDMRKEGMVIFSSLLKDAIVENYRQGNQTILFLNRRGYSPSLVCEKCGSIYSCPNCSIALTYHRKDNSIKCHYCGIDEEFNNRCKNCEGMFRGIGFGTQMVEQEVKTLLPRAKVCRMDSDTAGSKVKLMELYKKLENRDIDVLIGTQMVAKGHDLPGVTLVGVISADMSLGIPDFRSGEKTFQLITQVVGRAGRGGEGGVAVIQTFNEDHPSIRCAIDNNFEGFMEYELELRKSLGYPPFFRMVNIRFSSQHEKILYEFVKHIDKKARRFLSDIPVDSLEILGPSKCPIYRIKNRYRWQMILKSSNLKILHSFVKRLFILIEEKSTKVRFTIDVDPVNFY